MFELIERIKETMKNAKAFRHDPNDTSQRGHETEREVAAIAKAIRRDLTTAQGQRPTTGVALPHPGSRPRETAGGSLTKWTHLTLHAA